MCVCYLISFVGFIQQQIKSGKVDIVYLLLYRCLSLMPFYICTYVFVIILFIIIYSIVDFDKVLATVPNIKDVLYLLGSIKDKWYIIGVSLDVDIGQLEGLNFSNNSDIMKLSKVITNWKEKRASKSTWKMLLEAVEGPIVGNHEIGNDIRTFLKRPDVYAQYVSQG